MSRRRQPYIPSPPLAFLSSPEQVHRVKNGISGIRARARPSSPVTQRVNDVRNLHRFSRSESSHPGRAPAWTAACPFVNRMPVKQPDSRLERSGLSRPWEDAFGNCTRPTTSGIHRPHLSRARAKRRVCWGSISLQSHKQIEKNIVERGLRRLDPSRAAKFRTGKKVAIVGSGPAGLRAQQCAAPDTP